MADSRTYRNVTPAAFERLRSMLSGVVPLPPGNAGSLSSRGLEGEYQYDPGAQSLALTIRKYPLIAPKAMIWGAIERAVSEAGKA